MIIKQTHPTGQILHAVKSYQELTKEERKSIEFIAGYNQEDYADYNVYYTKTGKIHRVKPRNFSAKRKAILFKADKQIDVLDSMQLLFGNKHTKAYQMAKKKANLTNNEINTVRRIIKQQA